MPAPKKIFFSYSNQEEDLEFYNRIYKHFAAYAGSGLLGIIDKKELFRTTSDQAQIIELLKSSDITIPLLSIDFVNDENCILQLKSAATSQVKIVPVFLRDFDLSTLPEIMRYRNQILPDDSTPVEKQIRAGNDDDDTVFKEIALRVKAIILPEIGNIEFHKSSNGFYYIIASLVLVIGVIASALVYIHTDGSGQTERILFTSLCFLMFVCIGFISLKNVLFPNKIKIKK